MKADEIYRKFSGMEDDEWIEVIIRSVSEPIIEGVAFPGLPDPKLQRAMVGESGEKAIRYGAKFYREIKGFCRKYGKTFGDNSHILDFGCGFGRHYRYFLKDVPPGNIIGTDLDEVFIKNCRETIPMGHFLRNDAWPPSNLPENHFDLIYAHSVFSHLSEEISRAWIDDFAQILNPKGLLIVTTHSRRLIDFCASLRKRTEFDHPWQERAAKHAFLDTEMAHADYELGKFLFANTRGGGGERTPDLYGQAIIPPKYVQRHWSDRFDFLEFVDDQQRLQQAIIVLQGI